MLAQPGLPPYSSPMARAPNYSFERHERDRLKAIKTAEKAEAKRMQRDADAAAAARAAGGTPTSNSEN